MRAAHHGKVVLDPEKIENPTFLAAAASAHEREIDSEREHRTAAPLG